MRNEEPTPKMRSHCLFDIFGVPCKTVCFVVCGTTRTSSPTVFETFECVFAFLVHGVPAKRKFCGVSSAPNERAPTVCLIFSGSPQKRFFVICFVCCGRFVKRPYLPKNLLWGE